MLFVKVMRCFTSGCALVMAWHTSARSFVQHLRRTAWRCEARMANSPRLLRGKAVHPCQHLLQLRLFVAHALFVRNALVDIQSSQHLRFLFRFLGMALTTFINGYKHKLRGFFNAKDNFGPTSPMDPFIQLTIVRTSARTNPLQRPHDHTRCRRKRHFRHLPLLSC